MKAIQLFIPLIFIVSCNRPLRQDNEPCGETFKIEDSLKYKTAYFITIDSQYYDLSEKYYLPKSRLIEPYFIEKSHEEETDSSVFSIKKIFEQVDCNSKLIVEEIFFRKYISLHQEVFIHGQKNYHSNSAESFTLDTIASSWLRRKNRLQLDSMLMTLEEGRYICGSAQMELLEKDFPETKNIEISKDSALIFIRQYL